MRVRLQLAAGLVAGLFGVLLVLAAAHLDLRRCTEVARAHAETLARTAGLWLDGDAHAGLGIQPEKRLADLGATLAKLAEANDLEGRVRTLRPKAEHRETLANRPGSPRPGALEVVLATGPSGARKDVDYRPEMAAALEGGVASRVEGGRVLAYAAIPDAWGGAPALVAIEAPAGAPLWRRIAFPLAASLLAALLVWGVVLLTGRIADRLTHALATLATAAENLAAGRPTSAVALARRSPRELVDVARALESLRARLEGGSVAQATASTPATPETLPAQSALGEASEFDLALLMQQLIEPARGLARSRGIEVQLVYPDGLPSQVLGHPMVLFRALDSLLRSALRTTRQGSVTLRVSRANVGGDARLRFEVADTSPGIPFKDQAELGAALAAAAAADPATLNDPLHLASALSAALGGELGFVSQPGQGSRFGFTIASPESAAPAAPGAPRLARTGFHAAPAASAAASRPASPAATKPGPAGPRGNFPPTASTAFLPAPGTGFQPRPSLPPGPPASSFQPRPELRLQQRPR
ncbi:MAG TPA: ATP-binding protein [Planctomycetota bacterium]